MELDDSGMEILERQECMRLLTEGQVGRLGLVVEGRPLILPVNYGIDGDAIAFRTEPGMKLEAAAGHPVVLEVDELNFFDRSGWSVLIEGVAEDVTDAAGESFERLRSLVPEPWAAGPGSRIVRIVPSAVTGRRFGPCTLARILAHSARTPPG
jgi:nitroimidazol reductase NimA-like FMN-containing flavoprotein (pyridoxamine 5'-phosphate oxidase superfamily)